YRDRADCGLTRRGVRGFERAVTDVERTDLVDRPRERIAGWHRDLLRRRVYVTGIDGVRRCLRARRGARAREASDQSEAEGAHRCASLCTESRSLSTVKCGRCEN